MVFESCTLFLQRWMKISHYSNVHTEVPTSGYKKKDKEVADNAWLSLPGFFLHEQEKAARAVELFLNTLTDSVDDLLLIVSLSSSSLFSPSLCHLLLWFKYNIYFINLHFLRWNNEEETNHYFLIQVTFCLYYAYLNENWRSWLTSSSDIS